MKIIGNVGKENLLVEMTKDELCNICGRERTYTNWRASSGIVQEMPTAPGTVFKVADIFHHLLRLTEIVQQTATARKTLEAVASLLELPPCITDITEAIGEDRRSPTSQEGVKQ